MKLEKECRIKELTICHNDIKNGNSAQFNCFIYLKNDKEENILTKIYNSSKIKLTLEVEEPILDEEERKYLSGVISPFRDRVKSIKKLNEQYIGDEYILIKTDSNLTPMPYFKKDTMYKNMELNKEYTLNDLNL